MIGALIGLIILLVILGLFWWAGQQLLALVPMNETLRKVVHVLLIVLIAIIVIMVLIQLLQMAGIPVKLPRL